MKNQNFDEDAYLRANPDVAEAVRLGVVASGWEHYVRYGLSEGRPLTPVDIRQAGGFDEDAYLSANPDVADAVRAGGVASGWEHYVRYGYKENRPLSLSTKELNRVEKALIACDLKGLGLEIGPSYNPIAPKAQGFNVHILDYLDKHGLREKYANDPSVNIDLIEDVDFIWNGEPLSELIGKTGVYDWIIASHVIEHIPDVVSFLQQCQCLLKPNGKLSLLIPDKRYCFDYFNPISSTGALLDSYFSQQKRPSAGMQFDFLANSYMNHQQGAWSEKQLQNPDFSCVHTIQQAVELWKSWQQQPDYIDVHCWRFTPASFQLILLDLNALGLINLRIAQAFPSAGCEFHITLEHGTEPAYNRLALLNQRLKES